jgi:hypothetical protein
MSSRSDRADGEVPAEQLRPSITIAPAHIAAARASAAKTSTRYGEHEHAQTFWGELLESNPRGALERAITKWNSHGWWTRVPAKLRHACCAFSRFTAAAWYHASPAVSISRPRGR